MNNEYESPFVTRYASKEMSYIWSGHNKYNKWRKMWLILAESQQELGLEIKEEQIEELKNNLGTFDFKRISEIEAITKHDVMAHLRFLGDICPKAKPILHLGATSCFITDNSELLMLLESMDVIQEKITNVIRSLAKFANHWRETPCLSYTHGQPAQPTTVGKRACMWNSDFVLDLHEIINIKTNLKARGAKGTTGTQASYLSMFNSETRQVNLLNCLISEKMGFQKSYDTIGQTYSRKIDSYIVNSLVNFAQSAYKFANDIRILSMSKEIMEDFGSYQVGSSAMPYKKNPIKCERICSLSRFLMGLQAPTVHTAANQWLERSLDDSASRRITLAEAFLCADSIALLLEDVIDNLSVNEKNIKHLMTENLLFMITEELIIQAVKDGYDRQEAHGIIRAASHKADCDSGYFKFLLKQNKMFENTDFETLLNPVLYSGLASQQVNLFIMNKVNPLL